MIELVECARQSQAKTFSLVLASQGITHRVTEQYDKWVIQVGEDNFEAARKAIYLYIRENPDTAEQPEETEQYGEIRIWPGIWICLALIALHLSAETYGFHRQLVEVFGSSAEHILRDNEVHRAVTALFLHGDWGHLAANTAGILLFGTTASNIAGWGAGWFGVLLTGISGNLINAALYGTDHISIGASTAVFGAVGLLAANRLIVKYFQLGLRMKTFLPLAGGIALLGFLGSSRHTDIFAHLFGFVSGLALGTFYTLVVKHPPALWIQVACTLLSLGIVFVSFGSPYFFQ